MDPDVPVVSEYGVVLFPSCAHSTPGPVEGGGRRTTRWVSYGNRSTRTTGVDLHVKTLLPHIDVNPLSPQPPLTVKVLDGVLDVT